ncbi:MAG: DUF3826 domain-containing protein [Lacibacter sp.]
MHSLLAELRIKFSGVGSKTTSGLFQFILFLSVLGFAVKSNAQQANTPDQYRKTLTDRSAKIVNTLSIKDSAVYNRVVELLVNQYLQLNTIHDQSKIVTDSIKNLTLSADEKTPLIKKEEEKKSASLLQLHNQFLNLLKKNLSDDQIELVKDGMTYRVLPVTYGAYQDMIPALTAEQKAKIYTWLKEARELAMDEGSSDNKHKVFGRYKGRINNYLSAEGYDMKKEEKAWQERIKQRKQNG